MDETLPELRDHGSRLPNASADGNRWIPQPPPAAVSVLVSLYVLIALAVRRFDLTGDNGTTTVVIALMAGLGLVTIGVWHVFFSGYPRRIRLVPPLVLATGLAAFFAYFRIDHVTGEMWPVFKPRFSKKADERLALPQTAVSPESFPVAIVKPGAATGSGEPLDTPASGAAGSMDATGKAPGVDLRTTTPGDFPQFLGPDRSCAVENAALDAHWQQYPPQLVWRQPIGAGWSGFSIVNGFAVTQEQRGPEELVTCYDVRTGRVMWFHARETRYETVMGGVGPRATPTIHDGRVYALGATGWLVCLEGRNGRVLWERHVPAEFGISPAEEERILPFGRSNSPLIVDDLVVVPAGGPADEAKTSLVAYDGETGDEIWRGGDEQLSHASPQLATLAGVRQILTVNEDNVAGHNPATGAELWHFEWSGNNAVRSSNSQAIPAPPDKVFVSKGQAGGAKLVQLVPRGNGTFGTQTLWLNRAVLRTKFTNATLFGGFAYGLSDGILECIDLNSGERVWKAGRYKHGQLLRVGRHLLVLSEDGEVVLVEATPESPNHVLGRFQAITGKTWNNLALSAPYLLVRNAEEAACYGLPLLASANAARTSR